MMCTNIGLTILLWGVYFFVHSFLIANKVKNSIQKTTGLSDRIYRLIYSLTAIIGVVPIFYFLASTKSTFLFKQNDFIKYVSLAICTWGIIMIKQAFKSYSIKEFLGLKPYESKPQLLKKGLFKYVRHPIYSGTILLILGFWLFIPNVLNLVTVACFLIYLWVGIKLEEKKLINEFGQDYVNFQKEVPAVFPDLSKVFK